MKNHIENELHEEETLNYDDDQFTSAQGHEQDHDLRGPERDDEDEDDLDLGDADGSGGELEEDDLGA